MNLRKIIFILSYTMIEPKFYLLYRWLMKNQWKKYEEHKKEQEKYLRNMIQFAYKNVPYYHNLFKKLNLKPQEIKVIEDLEKLPILNKKDIKNNWEDFKPITLGKINYNIQGTAGSTGEPLQYRLERHDRFLGTTLMFRGLTYGGYDLGDKMVYFGGSSLIPTTKSSLIVAIHEIAKNMRFISSFDINDENMKEYIQLFNKFKPKYLRGYTSSIYFLAKWIEENKVFIHSPMCIFTTAERLFSPMREKIKNVFGTDVCDIYGLNDGGISAYEDLEHHGFHIDTERSIMEVVNDHGKQIDRGEGKILATSLHNFAMPFIRYDTGDMGYILSEEDTCPCGRGYRLLKEIIGREQEFLITPEGKHIHGEFISHIFWGIEGVKEFQIIQEKIDTLSIIIVPEKDFNENQVEKIKKIIAIRSPKWKVEFNIVDKIDKTKSGKYRPVINKLFKKGG
ncbi:MAG TPA: phenylacetate--CoA ligase family protein [Candidatus Atribacteria bacterium]|nr:phenylacetate--CoA ligase family protein [Candidatus Atribacteria bacterium]